MERFENPNEKKKNKSWYLKIQAQTKFKKKNAVQFKTQLFSHLN